MARVSIITALYNHERYAAQAMESVLAQTYADWELLLWDDGSQDSSLRIAREYADRHPDKIKVFTHSGGVNKGQERTRNAALEKATGEYLCLLDSDDLYHPRKLEWLVPLLEDPKVGLAYGIADHLLQATGEKVSSGVGHGPQGDVFEALLQENFVGAGATLFRRECLREGLRFDFSLKTMGEYPVWLGIARDWKFAYCPEVVSWWRCHGENLGTKLQTIAAKERLQLYEKLRQNSRNERFYPAVDRAVARARYGYAAALYEQQELAGARSELRCAFLERGASVSVRLKAALLFGLSGLGAAPNKHLARAKRRFWELRRR